MATFTEEILNGKKILSGKNFASEFSYIEVWFTDQSFKMLEIKHVEDKVNI